MLHDRLVLAKSFHGRLNLGQRLGLLAVLRGVALQLARAEPLQKVVVTPLEGGQFVEHVYKSLAAVHEEPGVCLVAERLRTERAGLCDLRLCCGQYHPPDTGGKNAISSPSRTWSSIRA